MKPAVKRAVKVSARVVGAALALFLILPSAIWLVIGPLANNIRSHSIRSEISGFELPVGAEMVDAASWVGNTGNGNHVEIVGGAIIRSDLSQADLEAVLAQQGTRYYSLEPLPLVDEWQRHLPGRLFPGLSEDGGRALVASSPGDWFVYLGTYGAATQLNLRAH
ncbi:MAG: hypothetical protein LBK54_11015 [Propionibacteriaceae bacterium]|jgi:hypothetical protein|nr:hypothetical protein [Propionibacteriaceae bacterium]